MNRFSFRPGQTILEAAADNGIHIPTLCYLKDAAPTGACRICLVEIKGARSLAAACAMPAGRDMEVFTDSPLVIKARKLNVELLLASGNHDCVTCEANGNCRLQDLAYEYGVEEVRFPRPREFYPLEDKNPFIIRDFSKCILCGRCVQACNEVQVNRAISYGYRGADSKIVTTGDRPYIDSDCVFCARMRPGLPDGGPGGKKGQGAGAGIGKRKRSEPPAPIAGWAARCGST